MDLRFRWFLGLAAALGLLAQLTTAHAQPASTTNYVLELDGTNGYVELPQNIFNELTEATVEFWARWDRLGPPGWNRVFSYGGGPIRDLSVATFLNSDLWFVICDSQSGEQDVFVRNVLRAREWVHVAAVSGQGGMRLYLNGVLVGSNSIPNGKPKQSLFHDVVWCRQQIHTPAEILQCGTPPGYSHNRPQRDRCGSRKTQNGGLPGGHVSRWRLYGPGDHVTTVQSPVVFSDGAYEIVRQDGSMLTLDDFAHHLVKRTVDGTGDLQSTLSYLEKARGTPTFEDDLALVEVSLC
jgi:hypothetical protein